MDAFLSEGPRNIRKKRKSMHDGFTNNNTDKFEAGGLSQGFFNSDLAEMKFE